MLLWEGPLECKPLPRDRMSMASLLPLLLRAPAEEDHHHFRQHNFNMALPNCPDQNCTRS